MLRRTLLREYRVAFSAGGQSRPVRIAKWALFLIVAATLFESSYFWMWVAGLPLLGIGIHFFYRWQTQGWTRAWGGWNDLNFDDEAPRS
jgi:hypothetical protein